MTDTIVVVPVGPARHFGKWLEEAIVSVAAQTEPVAGLLIVDDMNGVGGRFRIEDIEDRVYGKVTSPTYYRSGPKDSLPIWLYTPPWRLGVGSAFNHGAAVALNWLDADLALWLGADDKLEPRVNEELLVTYERSGQRDGYYYFDTIYSDGEQQDLPCNSAAVTHGFMKRTGGLPIEASGGVDAALISILLVHWPEALIHVEGPEARGWHRLHDKQESARLNGAFETIIPLRNWLTENFKVPVWGRF